MSHEPHNGSSRPSTIHPKSSGGGKAKWLIGAAAAAALVAGGIYAYQNLDAPQNSTELAYNDASPSDDTFDTASFDESPNTLAEETDTIAEPAATPARPARAAPARTTRRAETATEAAVPEQVVGVTPVSLTTYDTQDEVVIEGRRAPEWSRTPSARRLTTAYPERALERGREGEARVGCTIQENGALDCVRIDEYPANSGFGTAALRVARMFRHAPQRSDGSSAVGDPVNLRVVFRLAEDDRRG